MLRKVARPLALAPALARALVLVLTLVLALAPALVATSTSFGDVTLEGHFAAAGSTAPIANATAASDVDLVLTLSSSKNDTRVVNVTFVDATRGLTLANASAWNVTLRGQAVTRTVTVHVASNATGAQQLRFHVDASDAKGFPLGSGEFVAPLGISTVAPPPPPVPASKLVIPRFAYYVAAAVVLLLVAVALVRSLQKRREAAKPIPRSAALATERIERLEGERAAEVKAEIAQREAVRVETRERQILEAKVADARKTLDLLAARHERGQLTRFQYDKMRAKKEEELAKLEAELASEGGATS